jgi:hypothetical protein
MNLSELTHAHTHACIGQRGQGKEAEGGRTHGCGFEAGGIHDTK